MYMGHSPETMQIAEPNCRSSQQTPDGLLHCRRSCRKGVHSQAGASMAAEPLQLIQRQWQVLYLSAAPYPAPQCRSKWSTCGCGFPCPCCGCGLHICHHGRHSVPRRGHHSGSSPWAPCGQSLNLLRALCSCSPGGEALSAWQAGAGMLHSPAAGHSSRDTGPVLQGR